jgi:hypothetical protein
VLCWIVEYRGCIGLEMRLGVIGGFIWGIVRIVFCNVVVKKDLESKVVRPYICISNVINVNNITR